MGKSDQTMAKREAGAPCQRFIACLQDNSNKRKNPASAFRPEC